MFKEEKRKMSLQAPERKKKIGGRLLSLSTTPPLSATAVLFFS